MAIIIVPGGVELNEPCRNEKGYCDCHKDELTSQATSNTCNSHYNHIYICANNTINIDSAKTSLQQQQE